MNSDHYLPEVLSARTIAVLLMVLLSACSTLPRNTASMPEAESHHTREPVVDTEDADRAGAPTSPTDTILAPSMVEPSNLGEEAALRAIALLGKPYHYGGIDLKGFD